MPGTITTGSFAKDLWPGVDFWYGLTYMQYAQEHKEIFEILPSTKAFEEVVGATGFGLAQVKTEGAGVAFDSQTQGFVTTFRHVVYALGFIITKEARDDGLAVTKSIAKAKSLSFSMRQTKEIVHANVLNRGFNGNFVGGDGVELFSSAHPNKSGGTWRNELASPADLSEAALEQAEIDIAGFRDDRGKQIEVSPRKLIIPKELKFEANRILNSQLQSNTGNNATNSLRDLNTIPDGAVVNHYLTDTDAWFIKTNCPNGMISYDRESDNFDVDNDFGTRNARFAAFMRFAPLWADARGMFASEGS